MALSINNIFFPTDFSKNAERALPFAAEIARKSGAKLTLFHASQDTMDMAPNFEETQKETIREANTQFDNLLTTLEESDVYDDLDISTILQSGEPVTNLLSQIEEHNADLIVMGTKGATGDRNALFGSVTTSIIKKSGVPVLAVPNGSNFDKFKNIIFTTDYKDGDIAALGQTVDFAKLFNSNVDVVHVADQKGFETEIKFLGFRELVKANIDYEKLNFHLKYEYDFFPGMADYIIDEPTSLLVMVRYKKTFWEKLTERNHSKEMAFYSNVPLLMLVGEE
jgi:nucleotide-binding universal stress UspA family protein